MPCKGKPFLTGRQAFALKTLRLFCKILIIESRPTYFRKLRKQVRRLRNRFCKLRKRVHRLRNRFCKLQKRVRRLWNRFCKLQKRVRRLRNRFCKLRKQEKKVQMEEKRR